MTLVVDSSVVLAAVLNLGDEGRWAEKTLLSDTLVAPHHLPIEVAPVLRRRVLAREISDDAAMAAHQEVLSIPIEFYS